MAQTSIPVDLFNPGQVFACLGFLEAADQLLGDARGGFDWGSDEGERFYLRARGDESPFHVVLRFLETADVKTLVPEHSDFSTESWGVSMANFSDTDLFPYAVPSSGAAMPAMVTGRLPRSQSKTLIVDHWMDSTKRDSVKFWAGSQGKPGSAFFKEALELVNEKLSDADSDPFAVSAPQSGSFRFDWRRDYIALDVGFSPNEHKSAMSMIGYPIVEMLAAIGLTNARPRRAERTKLEYRYSVLGVTAPGELYDPIFLRAALGGAEMDFPRRDFTMQLGWPGKENQARCITNVIEEIRG